MSSRKTSGMPIQPAFLPIRKYCGKADSRSPHQFVFEFEMSSLYTGDVDTDIQNFLMVLGDQVSLYTRAFPVWSSFETMKSYFFSLTWTSEDERKELDAIKKEKFDSNGSESWREYIFRTYVRLLDCRVRKTVFWPLMNKKLREVGKSGSLVFEETKIHVTYADNNGETVTKVFHNSLSEFAKIVYQHCDDESQNHSKPNENISDVDCQPDSQLERQPREIPEIRPSDPVPVIFQGQKQEVISCRCGLQGSFLKPLLLSVFYFILYALVLQFWNFDD